jgi:hypothetical protein
MPRQARLGLGAKPLTDEQIKILKKNGNNKHLKIIDPQYKNPN